MWLQAFIIIFISIQKAFHFNYKQKCNATMQNTVHIIVVIIILG